MLHRSRQQVIPEIAMFLCTGQDFQLRLELPVRTATVSNYGIIFRKQKLIFTFFTKTSFRRSGCHDTGRNRRCFGRARWFRGAWILMKTSCLYFKILLKEINMNNTFVMKDNVFHLLLYYKLPVYWNCLTRISLAFCCDVGRSVQG